jgi:hypothetical protein
VPVRIVLSTRLPVSAPLVFVNAVCLCPHGLPLLARPVGVNGILTFVLARLFSAQFVSVCAACVCLRGLSRLVGVIAARRGLRGLSV